MAGTNRIGGPFLVVLVLTIAPCGPASGERKESDWKLRMSQGGRRIVRTNGEVFFYLGDTAWELFHRCDRQEVDTYLANRAAKGFNVIQAVALAELDGLTVPNAYGHLPMAKASPLPLIRAGDGNDYWDHVDYILESARKKGLYIGLLPTWGDKFNRKWGKGPVIFNPENAYEYGKWLGARYKDQPNIIWILGGDRACETDKHLEIIRQMARGLDEGDGGGHLMTYHPQGHMGSWRWFHEDKWLDFHMFQSGHHARDFPNYKFTAEALLVKPAKPVLDGEPRYEGHTVNWHQDGETGWFEAFDVRQAGYWSVLAGACGHTYGNHNIWQMLTPEREPISKARSPWYEAIHHPGSYQMGYMKDLFGSRPFLELKPDESIVEGGPGEGAGYIACGIGEDYAILYIPDGRKVTVNTGAIAGKKLTVWWFDPRNGQATYIEQFDNSGSRQFDPPGEPERGNDWVLVIDDSSKNYPTPGLRPRN